MLVGSLRVLLRADAQTCTPQLVQPIFVACMALIHEMRQETMMDGTEVYFRSIARDSYTTLMKALCRMAAKWKAVNTVIDLLEKRELYTVGKLMAGSGIPRPFNAPSGPTLISIPDTGILRRFTANKDHPDNIAQPTESSLRDSINRANQAMPVADILHGYTVSDMDFAPIGLAELEDLLGV